MIGTNALKSEKFNNYLSMDRPKKGDTAVKKEKKTKLEGMWEMLWSGDEKISRLIVINAN